MPRKWKPDSHIGGIQRLLPAMGISDMHRHIDWCLESIRIVPYSGSDPPAPIKIKNEPNKWTAHPWPCSENIQPLRVSGILRLSLQSPPVPGVKRHYPYVQHLHDPPSLEGPCKVLQDSTKTGTTAEYFPPHLHAWACFNSCWETGSGRAY